MQMYFEDTLRGETFAGRKFRKEKKREILGIYFREWQNEFFSREENFQNKEQRFDVSTHIES